MSGLCSIQFQEVKRLANLSVEFGRVMMKRENIYVGMRVKVKKSSLVTSAVGQYATVIDEPYDGCEGVYVHCIIDGDDDVYVFEICNIKISDEKPVVGDRIVALLKEPYEFFGNGASGIIKSFDEDGDLRVAFDRGDYESHSIGYWYVQKDLGHKYAIVRDVK